MLWLLLGIAAGAVIPVQTLVNTRLSAYTGTPFSSSMISFCVGTLTLAAALIAATGQLPSLSAAYDAPAWIWIGGFLGVIALTANIFMFPRLGAVETVVLPISGQIFMGLVIDHWGLFDAQQNPITVLRVVGALLVFAGVVATVGKPQRSADQSVSLIHWLWRLAGISFGMLTAMQSAINGRLGSVLTQQQRQHSCLLLSGRQILSRSISFYGGAHECRALVLLIPGGCGSGEASAHCLFLLTRR
ncbi:hypothetical protein CPTD_01784 [Corynebacterium pseudotuberculosis]|nr:Hypothetical protein CpE19_1597 [Corynebacterium pseudotuberculosis]KEX88145.1 hypothetical protein CPTD_01784 [Corynebacterium pseudotuberculosis]VTQ76939.1 Uncharacterized protein conserved in bacteria [Corynebacterium pseudotuberculosis]